MAAPLMLRRALLVLDMQNEFLGPSGRCKVAKHSADPKGDPPFVENVLRFAAAFRQTGNGDVIWMRSEFDKPRDANEEKVLLYEYEDEGEGVDRDKDEDIDQEDQIGKFDEFLSSATNPYCAKGTPAADFHESVIGATKTPGDRILKKTWYSAFKNTGLVEILRGRFATELFICGLKTNVSVFATASDAVGHGFQVTVLNDCVGYSDQQLHDVALSKMSGVLGCEVIRSAIMVKSWAAKHKPARSKSATQALATSKEDLTKMIEKLTLGGGNNEGEYESGEPAAAAGQLQPKDAVPRKRITQRQKDKVGLQHGAEKDVIRPSNLTPRPPLPPGLQKALERAQAHIGATQTQTYDNIPRMEVERPLRKMRNVATVLKEGDVMGEGDTRLVNSILPSELGDVAFEQLKREVRWRTMLHRGGEVPRLVAVEGDVSEDGSFPIYRHPADESPPLRPFSPTVSLIRDHVHKALNHPVNHVLIQYYRGGNDYISEHSDKTLDIVRGSYIVNVSLGAQRTMILRTKKDSKEWTEKDKGNEVASSERDPRHDGKQPGPPRTAQRIPLPHNSMFVLGEATNRKWLHAIKQDKRLPTLLSTEETSYGGERISLTFRHIGTFLTDNETKIWGQGATGKTREEAKAVFENNQQEVERMIFAFGTENHQGEEFDWDSVYGAGYDVLHFRNRQPKLFYRSQRSVGTTRVLLALSEKGVDVEVEESERRAENQDDDGLLDEDDISLADCDIDRTTMKGSIPILMYLESFYTGEKALGGIGKPLLPKPERHERGAHAQVLALLFESERLREAVEVYRKSITRNPPTSIYPSSSTQATKSVDLSSSQAAASPPDESASSTPPANPTKTHLQNTLDHFETQLYRISLGPSGKELGLTKGEEDVCFGGIGTNKCWSVADCAIWPVLRMLDKLRPDGGFWAELGGNNRWPQLGNYIKRGWERPRVRRVFMGTDKQSDLKEQKKEAEKIKEGVNGGEVKGGRGEVNASRGEVNASRGEVNASRGEVNASRGEVNGSRGEVNDNGEVSGDGEADGSR
ncbi:hypothetical protein L211DRAFT_447486 [Terfezia boudieri ATCC MYA-4762]|uniref:Fe2OG dioxygenase domain-containing protein n=1 Tax=Terfezia boudieri ATCC MYA-4762 TaxID=1051890 RepID=A0A3N4LEG6_9PEZI|nr:hypothetical protein L211DRAFT_447486 [Terfezia boudieri ATCC MYA-4762]